MNNSELEAIALSMRRNILDMAYRAQCSHIGSCYSIVEILAILYFEVLNIDPKDPTDPDRDIFILSKAHASAALYACLAERGFFKEALLKDFYTDGATLPGHLDRTAAPGLETSGGSLGHGLGLGVGMAYGRMKDSIDAKTYVLVSDGECNEGSTWEAVMLAPQLGLSDLVMLVDFNHIQSYGRTNDIIDQSNLAERLSNFGWEVGEVAGHDFDSLRSALSHKSERPYALVLDTVKGKGVSFMEDDLFWHYHSPDDDEYKRAKEELGF